MELSDEEIIEVYDTLAKLVPEEERKYLPVVSRRHLVTCIAANLENKVKIRKRTAETLHRIIHYLPKSRLCLTNKDIQYIYKSCVELSGYDTNEPEYLEANIVSSMLITAHRNNLGLAYPDDYYKLIACYLVDWMRKEPTEEQVNQILNRRQDRPTGGAQLGASTGRYEYVLSATHEDVREIGGPSL